MAERRERSELRGGSPLGWQGDRWPDRNDYRYAGETILGRADWGDRESDYEHGFRAYVSDRVGCGDICEGGHKDLVAWSHPKSKQC